MNSVTITIQEKKDGSIDVSTDFNPTLDKIQKNQMPDTHLLGLALHELVQRSIEEASHRTT